MKPDFLARVKTKKLPMKKLPDVKKMKNSEKKGRENLTLPVKKKPKNANKRLSCPKKALIFGPDKVKINLITFLIKA